jgi:hypothetical protein
MAAIPNMRVRRGSPYTSSHHLISQSHFQISSHILFALILPSSLYSHVTSHLGRHGQSQTHTDADVTAVPSDVTKNP